MFDKGCKATIMRVKVIINPRSGRGRAREQTGLIDTLGHRYGELDIVPTQRPGHATELARAAIVDGVDIVVALGGGGTLNQVGNRVGGGGCGGQRGGRPGPRTGSARRPCRGGRPGC